MNRDKGIWHAIGAYVAWGLLPFYWKQVAEVPALQLIGHRIVWSFFTLLVVVGFSRQRQAFVAALKTPRLLRVYAVAAVLIGINWFLYVWAVNSGFIVETSMGYFITPLVSVLFGVLLLRERLRPVQWVAVGLAAAGVLYLTAAYASLPWISVILAFSFGSYGLVKKIAPLGSVNGLAMETGILLLPAVGYLAYLDRHGEGAFLHAGTYVTILLVGAGLATTVPLLLFASAAQRIPLSLMGVFQYIYPTLNLLAGVLFYKEPFTRTQFVGFALVWAGLIAFGIDGLLMRRPAAVAVLNESAG